MQTPSPSKLTPQGWRSWARPPRGSPPAQDAEHTLCYGSVLAALLGLSVEAWPDPQGSGRGSWRPPGALGGRDCGGDNAGPLGVGLTWAGSGRRWPGCSQSTLAPSPPLRQPPSPQPDTPEAVTRGNWGGWSAGAAVYTLALQEEGWEGHGGDRRPFWLVVAPAVAGGNAPKDRAWGSGRWQDAGVGGLQRPWGLGAASPFAPAQDQLPGRAPRAAGSPGSPVLALRPGLLCRPPQDISLEEFDDEDLSEITDDCGLGLSYDSDHCEKVGKGWGTAPPHAAFAYYSLGVFGWL